MRGRSHHALLTVAVLASVSPALTADFELDGRVQPGQSLTIYLQGATTPFSATAEAGLNGRFRFRKLIAGTYILNAAGIQRTVEVGPGLADSKNRVSVTLDLNNAGLEPRARISVRELAVPESARREYDEADKALNRRDVPAAIAHLKKAVDLAPAFSAAWNHLGTIAYQTGRYPDAESYFRKGLETDPNSYAPLVNLGGVLINLGRWDEAVEYNLRALRASPNDALANSQLGMAYFFKGQLDLAEKYLAAAKRIDPSHFSHPQLLLAEIHIRRNQPDAAAQELEDLLKRHPDLPDNAKIRAEIMRLRGAKN